MGPFKQSKDDLFPLKEKDIKTGYSHAEIFFEISSCQNTKHMSVYSWVMESTAKLYSIIRLHVIIGWCFHLFNMQFILFNIDKIKWMMYLIQGFDKNVLS